MRRFFWSAFFLTRAEYRPKKPPYLDTFQAVPVDIGRKLNVNKTFRRRPGTSSKRLMYVQFTSYVYWVANLTNLNCAWDKYINYEK